MTIKFIQLNKYFFDGGALIFKREFMYCNNKRKFYFAATITKRDGIIRKTIKL